MSAKKPASRPTSSKAKPTTAGTTAAPTTSPSRATSGKRSNAKPNVKSSSQISLESKSRSGSRTSLPLEPNKSHDELAMAALPALPIGGAEEVVEAPQVDEGAEYAKRVEGLPLPYELLRMGLSNLGRSPVGLKQVFTKLSLPNAKLRSIGMLKSYPFIQTLELPGNAISDVSVLSTMRYLAQLDLSNNNLTEALDFDPPPYNLQHVDLSRNQIADIGNMGKHRFLMKLCLDRNLIRTLSGLSNCKYLTHLSLVNNSISTIQGLENLPLQFLDLRRNQLASLDGIETLSKLEELHLAHNSITDLSPLTSLASIRLLSAPSNAIETLAEIVPLVSLPLLRDLDLSNNPLVREEGYRLQTVFQLSQLHVLDALPVSPEEKVKAVNVYNPPPSVVASVQHAAMLKSWGLRQMVVINKVDLMRAKRLRPVVLCGPSGVGKRTLATRLIQTHPSVYGLAISHTTRPPRPDEVDGVHYHFTTRARMEEMVENGEFVQAVVLFGEYYGVSIAALDRVTEAGKIAVMCLELDGVLTLKRSPLKCYYVHVLAPDMLVLQSRLETRFPQPRGMVSAQDEFENESIPDASTPDLMTKDEADRSSIAENDDGQHEAENEQANFEDTEETAFGDHLDETNTRISSPVSGGLQQEGLSIPSTPQPVQLGEDDENAQNPEENPADEKEEEEEEEEEEQVIQFNVDNAVTPATPITSVTPETTTYLFGSLPGHPQVFSPFQVDLDNLSSSSRAITASNNTSRKASFQHMTGSSINFPHIPYPDDDLQDQIERPTTAIVEPPPEDQLDATSPLHRWIAKAALTRDYVEAADMFDLEICNEDLEEAFGRLEGFCEKERSKSADEED
ncbi:hypothetical protein HKX48_007442 [Thoreauomyces humboldtii]|nr:hypothetical protein HKX48_007442 [Thoreauomyces humboldtii]